MGASRWVVRPALMDSGPTGAGWWVYARRGPGSTDHGGRWSWVTDGLEAGGWSGGCPAHPLFARCVIWRRRRHRAASQCAGSPGGGANGIVRACSSWCPPAVITGSRASPSSGCCWRWTSRAMWWTCWASRSDYGSRPCRAGGNTSRTSWPRRLRVALIDVRPGERIGEDHEVGFAAAREAALAAGWQYLVVTGWRPHVQTSLDTLVAQRRPLRDQMGLQTELMSVAASGPRSFGELVAATRLPAVARAHALHLIWHRRLGIDLSAPLNDSTLVWAAETGGGR